MGVPSRPLELGIIGGGPRGTGHLVNLEALAPRVVVSSVCDPSEEVLGAWRRSHPAIRVYRSLDDLLGRDGCDAVLLCTPMTLHADQAIRALGAGKHVLSEVVAATTIEDCWRLVEAAEATDRVYMLAENYCYLRPNRMILNMVERGIFGDPVYAEGGYLHDLRSYILRPDGSETWRTEWFWKGHDGNSYPTHSLGPVALWLRVNREDRFVSTSTWTTRSAAPARYIADRFGSDHPAARPEYYGHGDSATTIVQTARGALAVLRVDVSSPRPHNWMHYQLQGSRASYLSGRCAEEEPLVWIEGRSPADEEHIATAWESLWTYADEFDDPDWRAWGAVAAKTGHEGGDFFAIKEFLDAIEGARRPAIDVYDAVTWSSILELSRQSVLRKGAPVEVPDFTRNRRNIP